MSSINLTIMELKNYEIGKYVDLLNDQGFKHVFGREANKDILIAFLNEIIDDRVIVDLEHMRNEQVPIDIESKKSVFDLYCKTQDGSRIVVELQKESQVDYVDRAIYYSTFPIQNQVDKGCKRYTFSAVYVINILNFNIKELDGDKDVISIFRFLKLNKYTILSNKYTLIFIELPKFTKKLEDIAAGNILDGFCYCLKNMKDLDCRPQELEQRIWSRLFEASRVAAMNKQEQLAYIKEMNTARDIRNQIEYAEERGIEKGRVEGKVEEKLTIARNMKQKGIDSATIAECTGLSVENIENF